VSAPIRRPAVAVMAKAPGVTVVKSRLHPALGAVMATRLYECFLRDRLDALSAVECIERMIEHLTARGARVLFNSNAISLSPARAVDLIASGLDELRVSLDATTVETYARTRGADAFPKVVANLERLSEAKRERGATNPRVSLWFTVMKDNIEEIPELVPLAARVGAAGIYLQRLVYNGLGLATAEQSLHARLGGRETELIRVTREAAAAAHLDFSASGATAP